MKVYNVSREDIGLIFPKEGGDYVQYNLKPFDYIVVSELTGQIRRLADPSIKKLMIVDDKNFLVVVRYKEGIKTTVNGLEGDYFEFPIDTEIVVKSVVTDKYINRIHLKDLNVKLLV